MQIAIRREISMGHRLPSYDGVCASMHGHNIRVKVDIYSNRFLDFKVADKVLAEVLEPLDHAMVLSAQDLQGRAACGQLGVQRVVLLTAEPTCEALADYIFGEFQEELQKKFPPSVASPLTVTVYETSKYSTKATTGGRVRRAFP